MCGVILKPWGQGVCTPEKSSIPPTPHLKRTVATLGPASHTSLPGARCLPARCLHRPLQMSPYPQGQAHKLISLLLQRKEERERHRQGMVPGRTKAMPGPSPTKCWQVVHPKMDEQPAPMQHQKQTKQHKQACNNKGSQIAVLH